MPSFRSLFHHFLTRERRRDARRWLPAVLALAGLTLTSTILQATEPPKAEPAVHAVRQAVETGLALVQDAARRYPEHRDCFSCHHQTLPMLAMVTAREKGLIIDENLLRDQATFTRDFYGGRIESVRNGEGVGGRGMTAAYALWALELAGQAPEPDDVAEALRRYLIKTQADDGRWIRQSLRPPLEESDVTATYLAVRAFGRHGLENTAESLETVRRAKDFLQSGPTDSQESINFRLWAAATFQEPREIRETLVREVLHRQREDGGWSQLQEMESDAYATGQTLYILQQHDRESDAEPLTTTEERPLAAVNRAVHFLLENRQAVGSWHVATRSEPIQRYFDNGDPHGADQFISTPATAWAVAALAAWLPEAPAAPETPVQRRGEGVKTERN